MKKYFYVEEALYHKGKYMIGLNHDLFPFEGGTNGSYNVLGARVLGLSYAKYLRFLRDIIGAELEGKNSLYIVPYFKRSTELEQLIMLMNKRMELVMRERAAGYDFERNENGELKKVPFSLKE